MFSLKDKPEYFAEEPKLSNCYKQLILFYLGCGVGILTYGWILSKFL